MKQQIESTENSVHSDKLLQGKVAVITGGMRGIGLAIAKTFGLNGANIIGISRNPDHYASSKAFFDEHRIIFNYFQGDVTNSDRLNEIALEIKRIYQRVNILVNNAGSASIHSGIKTMTAGEWKQVVDINLNSMFYVTSCMLPLLLNKPTRENASIINISSIAARIGTRKVAYTAAKAGVLGFTKGLAVSLAEDNILVNAILPGAVSTDLTSGWSKSQRMDIERKILLGSIAEAAEIADVALFLALPLSRYITGQSLDVNGGWVMP
ncbi:SDR family oxidoreductase [Candidatus Collierbacteria bacterium]|nr:SDR family oxidoreductase [Candidatus Collierbacteria bacterium]